MNIGFLINALKEDHYGIADEIEIAKGRWLIIEDWKQGKEQIKRAWLSRKS
jgi:hypothetical protein